MSGLNTPHRGEPADPRHSSTSGAGSPIASPLGPLTDSLSGPVRRNFGPTREPKDCPSPPTTSSPPAGLGLRIGPRRLAWLDANASARDREVLVRVAESGVPDSGVARFV